MSKSNLTLEIENQALRQFSKMGVFMCPECSFERAWIKNKPANCSIKDFKLNPKYTQVEGKHIRTEIVDILELNSQKGWVCYEIKISKSDFHSKATKSFVGDYNYYIMPEKLCKKVIDEIPKEIGVYSYDGKELHLIKKARKQKIIDDIDKQLYYGMVRALSRERDKQVENRIKSVFFKFNEIYEKIKKMKKEKEERHWDLKHHRGFNNKEQEIEFNNINIELDLLDDLYQDLMSLKYVLLTI